MPSSIRWNLGPDELDCEVLIEEHDAEPESRDCPGSAVAVEVLGMVITEGGRRRAATDEEIDMLEKEEEIVREHILGGWAVYA